MASVAKISSCVIPSTVSWPRRSRSLNISSPITAMRPDFSQMWAGCMDGSRNSCAPIRFISSRMTPITLALTRMPSGSKL